MYRKTSKDKANDGKGRNKISALMVPGMIMVGVCGYGLTGCGGKDQLMKEAGGEAALYDQTYDAEEGEAVFIEFDHTLDEYEPVKKEYNFYFTYKTVHPWWDAVAIGIEDAAKQYEEMGVTINYEYLAPNAVSAKDQTERLLDASERGFDVIGVDVADVKVITPVINDLIEDGQKVMTFSSSDADKEDGCNRIAYVGNTHNYEDGTALTEAMCEKLAYQGKIAVLVGTREAPCHEDRALGVQDVLAKYPDMEIVEIEYDEDSVEKAYEYTKGFLQSHQDLAGIVCCNMSNPVGAARAVLEAGREGKIIIVGMDHDQEALRYLRDGVIYALGVQDCYSIGFDTVQVAVKIADGCLPGELYPEKTEETTTIIYQDGAKGMLQVLYGEMD
jgi:ribose transport system substrate-binding protein